MSVAALIRRLPEGRAGRALALLLLGCVLGLAWLSVLGPVWSRYAERAQGLALQRATLARMQRLVATLPALRHAAAVAAPGPSPLIEGATDAVAGANLQDRLQQVATALGASIVSTENVPSVLVGHYRRIGLHVSISASFPTVIGFIARLEAGTPASVIDALHLRVAEEGGAAANMDCDMIVYAFRHADGAPNAPPASAPAPVEGSAFAPITASTVAPAGAPAGGPTSPQSSPDSPAGSAPAIVGDPASPAPSPPSLPPAGDAP
ncbi:type II secretion system protein M [Acetobacter sp. TBRC 12305]|uniref:Type II secretion system protein M n=1 Tax=Acetobacter garciniae TaxID=2817435 RepID=A0A939HPR2_9PROT|nr:type II secretion system protein GspM [Acetobacter garciniae]MBO1325129.1 type II secretion system protein M [Acetobacter garciniae]MBX0344900.1 type II secretion system protein M [Acetobacter garciniae]